MAVVLEPSAARDTDGVQPNPPWNLDRVDQRNLPLNDTSWHKSGAGVTAYVIDSGIRFTHMTSRGERSPGLTSTTTMTTPPTAAATGPTWPARSGKTYGVAKDVTLVGIRVLGCDGTGTVSDVLAAFDWVLANDEGQSVINLSMQFGPNQAIDERSQRPSPRESWSPRRHIPLGMTPVTNHRPRANRCHGCREYDIDARASFSSWVHASICSPLE